MKENHKSVEEKFSNEVTELKKKLLVKEKFISEIKTKLGITQE